MDFKTMDMATLTRSVTGGGVLYLELFLKEYTSIFGGPVNPSCSTCLTTYLTKYQNHFKAMENTCYYRLHAKYENIPLQFGSPILVNNANMTNEYAEVLLQQPNGLRFFANVPPAQDPVDLFTVAVIDSAAEHEEPIPPFPNEDDDDSELEGHDDFDILETGQPE
jgi:hypothetical protein